MEAERLNWVADVRGVGAALPSAPKQLWHVVHDDGDEEDLEEHELSKARKYFDEDMEEMPPDDDDEKDDDDEVVSTIGKHKSFTYIGPNCPVDRTAVVLIGV